MSRALFAGVLLVLAGCASPPALQPQVTQDLLPLLQQQGYAIDVDTSIERLAQARVPGDAQAMLAGGQGASEAGRIGGQAGVAGPGAGVAGALIGSLLVAQINASRIQAETDRQAADLVAPLRQAIAAQGLDFWFTQTLQAELAAGDLGAAQPESPYRLRFEPQAIFGDELDRLHLVTEISLLFGHEVLYRGRIEVIDAAPWPLDSTANLGLQPWLANDAAAYRQVLHGGLREMLQVLLLDMQTGHFAASNSSETTLRYQLGGGRFVERGRLLAQTPERSLFMDMRGWLKSVPLQAAR
ncbi:hypothetical protein [Pseudomonas mangrovi]|uniref:Lipoprotein n=1 Tax=Pseudomonas mangrovi TaxID=2161748 RepID=A0A2T5PAV0_9PSED|nr:hypothetical protein [Pseudomonas mangrovi]PTU74842.1 hypothetical protein DBO85_08035 [Pseudomonas mangrovi]